MTKEEFLEAGGVEPLVSEAQWQRSPKRKKRMGMVPMAGFSLNPLRELPRNMRCPCGSGNKFKDCHLDEMPHVLPTHLADKYRPALKRPELIQFTEEDVK